MLNYEKYQATATQSAKQLRNRSDTINKNSKNNKNITKVSEPSSPEINQIFNIFYESINPNINYGNTTNRSAIEWLIKKYGFDKVKHTVEYACQVQGKKYAPTITTPYQLKIKMADLMVFYKRDQSTGIQSL